MNTLEFIAHLRKSSIEVHLDEGSQLRVKARKGALTEDLREELKSRKAALLEVLIQFQGGRAAETQTLERAPADAERPLSFAQERLWFIDQLEPGGLAFQMPMACRLIGPLNEMLLERALYAMILNQESLRTAFAAVEGKPRLVIAARPEWSMGKQDFSGLPEPIAEAEATRAIGQFVSIPFHLGEAPLFRAMLLRMSEGEHRLVLNMHHIIADGWSLDLLAGEWVANYQALSNGQNVTRPPMPIQYSDFAYWQRRRMPEDRFHAHLDYWVEKLAGLQTLELPTKLPRPARQTHVGALASFTIDVATAVLLKHLAHDRGASVFMVLLACFKVLLQRYSGQTDIVAGTSIGNRDQRELESIVGLFVNLLALRTDLSRDPTFAEVLDRVKATALEAFQHQEIPFERIVDARGTRRDPSRHPLFQVQMIFVNTPRLKSHGANDGTGSHGADAPAQTVLRIAPLAIANSVIAKMDLTLHFQVDADESLVGEIEYNTDLFQPATIDRMIGHLRRVMGAVAAQPSLKLSQIPMLDAAELNQLAAWNRTARSYPRDQAVHRAFEEQVARTPQAPAISDGETVWTYAELNQRANQLAHHLLSLGVEPGAPVGFCLDQGHDAIAVLLAILKSGGAYVPLDPSYPQERLSFMVEDSAMTVLITRSELLDRLPGYQLSFINLVVLDEEEFGDSGSPGEGSGANPGIACYGESPAYIVYTSGTTGRPKGVQVCHRNIMRLVHDREYVHFKAGMTMAQVSNLSFDALTFEVWTALLFGGRLGLIDKETYLDGARFAASVEALGADTMFMTSALFSRMAATQPAAFNGFANLLVGGDRVEAEAVRQVQAAGGPWRLINGYGPTECTTFAVSHLIGPIAAQAQHVAIGQPIANTTAWLLDRQFQPVPVGVHGELYLGGEGLAWGYLNRPDLTAARFLPDPFSGDVRGGRLYRSGDLARRQTDGVIVFLGRADGQIKLRGFRVELGEITHRLREVAGVEDAFVMLDTRGSGDSGQPSQAGEKRLVAYLTGPNPVAAGELKAFLAERLPEYMVPAAFVFLDAFPLTPNGKLDRAALPEPGADHLAQRGFQAPRTPTEEVLAAIWCHTLGIERVGGADHFFDLGGHSLLATQLVSRVRDNFDVDLPLRTVFEHSELAAMAAAIDALRAEKSGVPEPAIEAAEREFETIDGRQFALLPASFAQERLLFLDRLGLGAVYNIPIAVHLRGRLRVELIQPCLDRLVARHESLRTRFAERDGQWFQVIAAASAASFAVVDLSAIPRAEGDEVPAEFQPALLAESRRPFELGIGPLLRVTLFQLPAARWVLLFNMHHIIADAWSLQVLFKEFLGLYHGACLGHEVVLPEPGLQYGDFAVWQRRWLTGSVLDRQMDYWAEQLADIPQYLDLPSDFPRPPVQTFEGRYHSFAIGRETLSQANLLGGRLGLTRFMWLLAGFSALLGRLAGQSTLVIGTSIANRNRSAVEGMIGFFVNTLAIPVRLGGDPTFTELLDQVRRSTLDAYAHQDLPFEQLVERLHPVRDTSRTPIFQVILNLVNVGVEGGEGEVNLPELALWSEESDLSISKFDLTLSMTERGGELIGGFEYSTALFLPATMVRLEQSLRLLLDRWTRHPECRLSRLDLLDESGLRDLERWHGTVMPFPAEESIEGLFAVWAGTHPESVALAWTGGSLTYRELDRRANRLAHLLRKRGFGRDGMAGVCLTQGPERVIGVLAIAKAGGAYVPLDSSYPADRLKFMIEDAEISVLLTQSSLVASLPDFAGTLVLEEVAAELAACPETGLFPANLGHSRRACLVYTSGTTGLPKGGVLTHGGLIRLILHQPLLEFNPGFCVAQVSNFSFDVAIYETWLALLRGGCLYLVDRETYLDMDRFAELVAHKKFDFLALTTLVLNQIATTRPNLLEPARYVLFGGEKASPAAVRAILDAGPPRCLLHAYGPSENTAISTWEVVKPGSVPENATWLPLGRTWPNSRLCLLDRNGRPVIPGAVGELCIGGDGLAQGYQNRPALTAARFVPDPFCGTGQDIVTPPGSRLYRTGDLGRRLGNGDLVFVGRIDHQIKLRGFRIEPAEIEYHLRRYPGVDDAAVLLARGQGMLVAYLAAIEPLDQELLRQYLASKLPGFMVPSAFVTLPKLPLTPNHKLDRAALPEPQLDEKRDRPFEVPGTPTEEILAAIWASLLQVPAVSAQDNFFDLGGHSLVATRLISAIRSGFAIDLPLFTIFEAPVLAAMAARVDAAQRERRGLDAPPLVPVARGESGMPLSFAQERLWFLDRLGMGAAYHMPTALRIDGALDVDALRAALGGLIQRHESLRTHFEERDGRPLQVIEPEAPVSAELTVYDLRNQPQARRESESDRIIAEEAARAFDLATGPLFRGALLHLAPESQILMFNMHHIISDGWSLQILLGEFAALYEAAVRGQTALLPALPIQYADFAVWQREWLRGAVLDRQLTYWAEQLAGAPPHLDLPFDFRRPPVQTFEGASCHLELSAEVSDAGGTLCSQTGVTRFMWVLAAYGVLLARYSGQGDLVIGTTIANRNRAETEGLIGFFVNTLALRVDLSGDPSFRDLLDQVRRMTLDAHAHQDLPFEQLVEKLQPERDPSRTPIYQVVLNMINLGLDGGPESLELPGASLSMASPASKVSKFDLTLSVGMAATGLTGEMEYNRALFRPQTVEGMCRHFETLIANLTAAPDLPLSRVAMMTADERLGLLRRLNSGDHGFDGGTTIHARFERQVALTPAADALLWGAETWSYAALNARANVIAHELIARGVGPECRVAVCLNRSPDLICTLLAIFKAGGAYVPLDPGYPAARLESSMTDAAALLLVTDSSLADGLPVSGAERLLLDQAAAALEKRLVTNPALQSDTQNLAYVLFTSGSTGRPKGVAIAHRAVAGLLDWAGRVYEPAQLERVAAVTSVCFDLSVFELFLPLTSGGAVVLVADALALAEIETPVSLINTVPSAIAELLRAEKVPKSARTINLAGEPLPGELARALYRLPHIEKVYNLYGPSEDTTYSTFALVDRDESLGSGDSPEPTIGVPIHHSRCYLLDARMDPVPMGCPGEIYLAGEGLARGYLGRPDLTAERFLPDPFTGLLDPHRAGERLYRTGDLARFGLGGELVFIGRADHQVKLRGFRIELGEIESQLRRRGEIRQAVVTLSRPRDGHGGDALTAYLVAATGTEIDLAGLRRDLAALLPAFMVPAYFVVLDALPLTPNGKLDRRALPAPEGAGSRTYLAPRTESERVLATIWSELLGLERVSATDNFFELGGHSLMMAQVVSRLKHRLDLAIPLATLFEYPVLEGLARFIDMALNPGRSDARQHFVDGETEEDVI